MAKKRKRKSRRSPKKEPRGFTAAERKVLAERLRGAFVNCEVHLCEIARSRDDLERNLRFINDILEATHWEVLEPAHQELNRVSRELEKLLGNYQ